MTSSFFCFDTRVYRSKRCDVCAAFNWPQSLKPTKVILRDFVCTASLRRFLDLVPPDSCDQSCSVCYTTDLLCFQFSDFSNKIGCLLHGQDVFCEKVD
jgi:hypothetical protein